MYCIYKVLFVLLNSGALYRSLLVRNSQTKTIFIIDKFDESTLTNPEFNLFGIVFYYIHILNYSKKHERILAVVC